MKHDPLQDRPAIIIAAFGSSRRGKTLLANFDANVRSHFPSHEVFWGYTSRVIRKKTGNPSLHQALSMVESEGFRRVVVLPLQIFPGSEYREIAKISYNFPGLRCVTAETLMHRWQFIGDVLGVIENDFLAPQEGVNLLALHGTPMVDDPANSGYLGMERLVGDKYENVLAASLEGAPDYRALFNKINREKLVRKYSRIRIIPMLFLAGLHVEDDLMGPQDSWKKELEDMGFMVECEKTGLDGDEYFKSLASYREIQTFFIERIERALNLMESH